MRAPPADPPAGDLSSDPLDLPSASRAVDPAGARKDRRRLGTAARIAVVVIAVGLLAASVVLVSLAMFAKNLNAIFLVSIRHPVQKPGVAGAAAFVNSHATPGDAIVVAHSLIYFSFKYYNHAGIRPTLYATVPFERFADYAGRSVLDPGELTPDLCAIHGPKRVWYLWTDGFYQKKLPVPAGWHLETTRRFEDTPGYKGSIYVEEYALSEAAR